jgi:hypothetical protein
MNEAELLRLAIDQKPCSSCSDPGCRMARIVLYANGYKFIKTDAKGRALWEAKP